MVLLLVILIPVLVSSAGTSAHYEMLGTCRMVCDPYGGTKAPSTAATPDRGLMQSLPTFIQGPKGEAGRPGKAGPRGPPGEPGGRWRRRGCAPWERSQSPGDAKGARGSGGRLPAAGREPAGAPPRSAPGARRLPRVPVLGAEPRPPGLLGEWSLREALRCCRCRSQPAVRAEQSSSRPAPGAERCPQLCRDGGGERVRASAIAQDADQNYDYASNSVVLHLEPGDEVYIKLDGGKAHGGNNNKYSTFSGFIIYAD
ncbi:C1QL3 protein, partial [Zosterops hypoxanthus]|nr:C1QL3 protein [Zosterops hypoxanthus]